MGKQLKMPEEDHKSVGFFWWCWQCSVLFGEWDSLKRFNWSADNMNDGNIFFKDILDTLFQLCPFFCRIVTEDLSILQESKAEHLD